MFLDSLGCNLVVGKWSGNFKVHHGSDRRALNISVFKGVIVMKIRDSFSAIKHRIFCDRRPALNDLDRKLEKYLNFRNGFFIEAGANDGFSQSNTYRLEKMLGWRGVLVEGVPELYEKCRFKRSKSFIRNCALVSMDYQLPTIEMHYAHLMSVVDGSFKSRKFQKEHVDVGLKVQGLKGTYVVVVPARTLTSVLNEINSLPAIDFLSLDVEGYELEVLRGLDFAKYRPKFILVEARYFEEVDSFLQIKGYVFLEQFSQHDFFYRAL